MASSEDPIIEVDSEYFEEVHRVSVPKPLEGERLGLTVQEEAGCVVVTRILNGSLVDQVGQIQLGDIILEVNDVPITTAEELMVLVPTTPEKNIHFLVKKMPESELRRYGIPTTPSLRKHIAEKAPPEQRILCHVRALFDYDPFQDNLTPCPEAGLAFQFGDVLAVLNQDDPNWWQARHADFPQEPAKIIPSRELEERRKAFVRPEADYSTKIGLCGALVSRKKQKQLFKSQQNSAFDKADLVLYEEVTLMKPFKRKVIVVIGTSLAGRRTLKNRILNSDPDNYGTPLPHTSRPKRPEEDNGMRYWFVDREDMELGIKNHEFLEYGELNGHLYGTRVDSVKAIVDAGKTCVLDPSPQALKILRGSSEFMPFVVFLAAPGLEEMKHVYENQRITNSLIAASKTLSDFERTSSIRNSSRRAKTLDSISSLYVEEDVMKTLEDSARLQRAYGNYFDLVVVNENYDQSFRAVMEAWYNLSISEQWVPSSWVYS